MTVEQRAPDKARGPGETVGRGDPVAAGRGRLARQLQIERTWTTDREAMKAALRVVLDLPRVLPSPADGGHR